MKIEEIEISKLKPATYNPRQITKKQVKDLKESIEKFGIVDPIVINKDFTIIGGHQRYMILKEASKRVEWEYPPTIPCVMLDLSKEEERELNIRLNKNTGDFDMDILANEFDIDELTDWGFKHIDLDLNIDKIDEDTDDSATITIKEDDLIKAKELYNNLKEKGYNVKIK
jgi:ParB-like chromosome segregation protein Spo0J